MFALKAVILASGVPVYVVAVPGLTLNIFGLVYTPSVDCVCFTVLLYTLVPVALKYSCNLCLPVEPDTKYVLFNIAACPDPVNLISMPSSTVNVLLSSVIVDNPVAISVVGFLAAPVHILSYTGNSSTQ